MSKRASSQGLEDEEGERTDVEVDEVALLVGDVGTEVLSDNDVPGVSVLGVELVLERGGDLTLQCELLDGGSRHAVDVVS